MRSTMKLHKDTALIESRALAKLQRLKQEHLLAFWERLSPQQKEHLLEQIDALDEKQIDEEQRKLRERELFTASRKPLAEFSTAGSTADKELGRKLMSQGKCACVILAGGVGSRLRFSGPKGCFPVTAVKKKSLFALVSEKVVTASLWANFPLEIAIMTSPKSHVEIETYFVQNGFFGLKPSTVHFFYQKMWLLLDERGNLFLESPDTIAFGPNGNGGVFHLLQKWGLMQKWKEKGVEIVSIIPIDNPLADPFDAELFGFHSRCKNEVTIKAAKRLNSQEKVGVIMESEGRVMVTEYSELTQEEKSRVDTIANLGLFSFDFAFIQKISSVELPMHCMKKSAPMINAEGKTIFPKSPNAWKFERFIFDVLPFAKRVSTLLYPREECFAPLKNNEGADSIKNVQAALQEADRRAFYRVTGRRPSTEKTFELSPQFYYPTEALLRKWRDKELPNQEYIEEK